VRIIPVIDLLEGAVVHAKQGQRQHYQPIISSLTNSYKPLDIVKAFMDIYPFDTLYIADLNAIQKLDSPMTNHQSIIANNQETLPTLNIWLDAGIRNQKDAKCFQTSNVRLVVGTESTESMADYKAMLAQHQVHPIVLSLDFMPSGYQGLELFINNSQYWPQDVIVMTLSQVGTQQGIDHTTLQKMTQLANQHRLYAAGGVGNKHDIEQLVTLQVHGALVATALHNKQIDTALLQQLMPQI
jgi:phosphoribosylformimino-5-aminoimidazole carboxamide ribotide isomerase